MKTYLDVLLTEFVVQSTSDYAFDTPGGNSSSLQIPISGPMFKRIWPDTIRATVFHTTDLGGLERLAKLEGGKKSISAFFSMMSRYMETGVATAKGVHVVVEMDADVLVSARDDIWSQVDKQGRRWVELQWFANAIRTGPEFGKMEKDFNTLIKNLVKKHLPSDHFANPHLLAPLEVWSDMKRQLKAGTPAGAKKISLVIKDYFDGVEKVIKKNKKVFETIFYGYAKSKRMTDNAWDEQIVNNIKVKKLHVIKPHPSSDVWGPDEIMQHITDIKKWQVQVWDASIELEAYTRQVVAKEIGRKSR